MENANTQPLGHSKLRKEEKIFDMALIYFAIIHQDIFKLLTGKHLPSPSGEEQTKTTPLANEQ